MNVHQKKKKKSRKKNQGTQNVLLHEVGSQIGYLPASRTGFFLLKKLRLNY